MKKLLVALVLVAFGLAACVGPSGPGPKTQIGAATGAATGGLIAAAADGSTEAVIAGVLLGGLLGGAVGSVLDDMDRQYAATSAYRGLEYEPSGASSEWYNPDSGNSGSITPTHTYRAASGAYCREFTQTVTIDGWSERAYGTACRQPDGSWRIIP
jgi:surface antigen